MDGKLVVHIKCQRNGVTETKKQIDWQVERRKNKGADEQTDRNDVETSRKDKR